MPSVHQPFVLIVDSDARRAAATAAGLPVAFAVEFARGGAEALALLGRPPGACGVVIERDLPDVDGFALARRIRAAADGDGAHTVVLGARETAVPFGVRDDCDAYFVEPDGPARGFVAGLALSLLAA